MTEYIINIDMCKSVKCTICSMVLKNKTVFMMHDKPFCSTKCKEKFFYSQKPSSIRNHLNRSISYSKLPVNIEPAIESVKKNDVQQ